MGIVRTFATLNAKAFFFLLTIVTTSLLYLQTKYFQ